ncbi:MAG: tetratricopeptide repeat protein [Chloroflexota bacterium]
MGNDRKETDWFRQGNRHYEAGRYEEAARCYEQAVKSEPRDARAWNNRGLSLDALKRREEAIPCYDMALGINPKYIAAWCNRGISLNSLGRYQDALVCFRKALEIEEKHAIVWHNLGNSLRGLGKVEEALKCYGRALALDPQHDLAWYHKAVCEDELGLRQEALASYNQFLLLAAGLESAKKPVTFVDHALQRIDELAILLEHKSEDARISMPFADVEVDPYDASKWIQEGDVQFERGDYVRALACFDQAIKYRPQYADAWCKKAECEEHLGHIENAIFSYRQTLDFAQEEDLGLIQYADRRLLELEGGRDDAINRQENTTGWNQQVDQGMTELSEGASYQPGDVIGQIYQVHSVLGQGGFGVVYLVFEVQQNVVLALKTVRDEYLADPEVRERFRKEAGLWVYLGYHPCLVRAFLIDEISGRLFIAMEYIPPNEQGLNSLAGYLQRRPPDLAQGLRWAIQVCHGMEYALSKGVRAHRDLKPDNIMISQDGRALVTDFGLAGVMEAASAAGGPGGQTGRAGETQMGVGFGTPLYMPPEQFLDAASCDQRSDIYALGVILYQLASGGRLPFLANPPEDDSGDGWGEMRRLHSEAPVPPLESPLFPVIRRCLEKQRERRYQRFEDLRSDLEILLARLGGEAVLLPKMEDPEAYEWSIKGISLNHLGRCEEALRCHDQALELDPSDADIWNNKGLTLSNLGRNDESLLCYDQALELDPRSTVAWINKGGSLTNLGRNEEALRCHDRALELDPRSVVAWSNKGGSLAELGRNEEALRCYDRALELDPLYVGAWYNKGHTLANLGRSEEALPCYDRALEIDPCDARAWYNKGHTLADLGCNEEALHCYDQALEFDPRDASAWYNKGGSLTDLGRIEEALHCYDQALELDPRYVNAWYNKGRSLALLGRIEEALHCFDQTLELDPRNTEAWYNKGVILADLDRNGEALRCFDWSLELDPRNAKAWLSKGLSLANLGRFEEALRCFDQALELNPRDAMAWYGKAVVEEELGRKKDALRSYRQFLALAPAQTGEDIQYARARIRALGGR